MPNLLSENLLTTNVLPDEDAVFTAPGLVPMRAFETIDIDDFAYTIVDSLKKHGRNVIYFSDIAESFESRFLNLTDCVASKLINVYDFDPKNIKFVSGANPLIENYHLYNRHTRYNNWITLDCTLVNSFEFRMKRYIDSYDFQQHGVNLISRQRNLHRPKIFTFLNGGVRLHRLYLFSYIVSNNLLGKGYVSMHTTTAIINNVRYQMNLEPKKLPTFDDLLDKFQLIDTKIPMLLTIKEDEKNLQHTISSNDLHLFDTSYFSIIGETSFFKRMLMSEGHLYNPHLEGSFLTEKTFRAIACQHPFIMMSRPHTLKHLRRFGYKTFAPYIDETYDDIEDDHERLLKISELVKNLCAKNPSFWRDFVHGTKDIVKHNFEVLMNAKLNCFTYQDFLRTKPTNSVL